MNTMKQLLLFGLGMVLILLGLWYFADVALMPESPVRVSSAPVLPALSREVEGVIAQKTSLIDELARDAALIEIVKSESQKSAAYSAEEIAALDLAWRTAEGETALMQAIMANPASTRLKEFRSAHPEFPEIFVTDVRGLNSAQTNRTSDYYQADEEWWVRAYSAGRGARYHGEIEFDESAQAASIPLYVPIVNEEGQVIGIMKAVLDMDAVTREI